MSAQFQDREESLSNSLNRDTLENLLTHIILKITLLNLFVTFCNIILDVFECFFVALSPYFLAII